MSCCCDIDVDGEMDDAGAWLNAAADEDDPLPHKKRQLANGTKEDFIMMLLTLLVFAFACRMLG